MNLVEEYGAKAAKRSISQFDPPRCFELAGKEFKFVMDTGEEPGDILLRFLDGKRLAFDVQHEKRSGEVNYECRKADDQTYLVTYCLPAEPRENHTFIIDMEQMLVTFLRTPVGENPYYPYLIESHWTFGYIAEEGKEHTDIRRHGFTDDVRGTSVRWVYGHELSTVHVYHSTNWYRIRYSRERLQTQESIAQNAAVTEGLDRLPNSDEPAFYVKIKEGMYLVSITEQFYEKILGSPKGRRSDTLCFLDNWNRFYSVGRAYGTKYKEGEPDVDVFNMIGKYAMPQEVDEHFFTDPCPYLV